jgi:glycosyltransferase involved in cell wall biosynthesis
MHKKQLLFVSARCPYPCKKGDQLVAWERVKALSGAYDIDLVCFVDEPLRAEDMQEIRKYCRKVITFKLSPLVSLLRTLVLGVFGSLPLQVYYYADKRFREQIDLLTETYDYDVVHAVLMRIAPHVQKHSDRTVLDMIDAMSVNLGSRMKHTSGLKRMLLWFERRRVLRYEKFLAKKFRATLYVSEHDRLVTNPDRGFTIPNGTEVTGVARVETPNPNLLFVGNMAYAPNNEAMKWYLEHVWPKIRAELPQATLTIVGRYPADWLLQHNGRKGVIVTGEVDSIVPHLGAADLFVAPMQSGSGMQNKVIEAMAAGLPVVTSSVAANGFSSPLPGVVVADKPAEIVQQTVKLLGEPDVRSEMGRMARQTIDRNYRWHHAKTKVFDVYGSIGLI